MSRTTAARRDLRSALIGDRVRWGVAVHDLSRPDDPLLEVRSEETLRVASVGKLALLVATARGVSEGSLDPAEPLSRSGVDDPADSGLWQHLAVDALPLGDLARLVGVASDNLAANVLLDRVGGVPAVAAAMADAGAPGLDLHDRVRAERSPADPPTLATGSAAGCARLLGRLHGGTVVDRETSARVLGWLTDGVDLSMVGAAFGLDPLSHSAPDRGFAIRNKTGSDRGVRADVGIVEYRHRAIAYACIANWDEASDDPRRDAVLRTLRRVGDVIRGELTG